MKRGFTLIELLAVIVILAIIALIATPIILGIINDARKESNERSAELYASAVRNAIASYQLTHPNTPTKFSDLDVQYDGEVECETQELYADGSFYIAECTVNGNSVDYTYGTRQENSSSEEHAQIYKPQYYWFDMPSGLDIGVDFPLPSEAKKTPLEIDTEGYPYYIGFDVDSDNKVTAAYVCFAKNEIEYCLKGADTEAFATNKAVLEDAFKENTENCSFSEEEAICTADSLAVYAYYYGQVGVEDEDYCFVGDGNVTCDME